MPSPRPTRRTFLQLAIAVALGSAIAATPAAAHRIASPAPSRVTMTILDRATGQYLPAYHANGQSYIEGGPGREYAIRLVNTTGRRVLAVTSVDGVNVISGDTASPDQTGYVLEPYGSVEIIGWRKSHSRTAAFFFSEHSQSYAARTGRPFDVGVIGVAVFEERQARPSVGISEDQSLFGRSRRAEAPAARAEAPTAVPAPAPSTESPGPALRQFSENQSSADRAERADARAQPLAKLGTGHGRSETSHIRTVNFVRATPQPVEILSLRYDRYENLVAMGVIPARPPHYANRNPQPFPGGLRFAPDPN